MVACKVSLTYLKVKDKTQPPLGNWPSPFKYFLKRPSLYCFIHFYKSTMAETDEMVTCPYNPAHISSRVFSNFNYDDVLLSLILFFIVGLVCNKLFYLKLFSFCKYDFPMTRSVCRLVGRFVGRSITIY